MGKKGDFFNTYANLPLPLRDEVILVIDEEPITWKVAYLEIVSNTKLGKKILEKIIALEIV